MKIKIKIKITKIIPFLVLFLLSVIFLRTLFTAGIPYSHDANNHLARLANFYLAFRDRHFPPRWGPNLNYKFGYPVFNFNYYFPYALSLPFIILGLSLEASWKAVVLLSFFSGGVFAYLLLKDYFKTSASLAGAIFYILAPYQLVNIFVRGMTGEIVAFSLLPLILWLYQKFFQKQNIKLFLILTFVLAGFLLTHNIIVLITIPLIVAYFFLYSFLHKRGLNLFLKSLLPLITAVCLTLFFWLPAMMEKQYTNLDMIDMTHFYQDHFSTLPQLVNNFWGYGFSQPGTGDDGMSFSVGPVHFLLVVLTTLIFIVKHRAIKKDKKIYFLSLFSLISFWFSFVLMLNQSSFIWQYLPFVNYIQFPWRLLFISTLSSAFLIGLFFQKRSPVLTIIVIVMLVVLNLPKAKPQSKFHYDDYFYYEFMFTSSTKDENMPIWFHKHVSDQLKTNLTSDTGMVNFRELLWKTNEHIYELKAEQPSAVIEHTAYFPGWEVYLDDKQVQIDYDRNDYPGLISFEVSPGEHQVKTIFTENTPARKKGNWISALTFISLVGLFLFDVKKNFKKRR